MRQLLASFAVSGVNFKFYLQTFETRKPY